MLPWVIVATCFIEAYPQIMCPTPCTRSFRVNFVMSNVNQSSTRRFNYIYINNCRNNASYFILNDQLHRSIACQELWNFLTLEIIWHFPSASWCSGSRLATMIYQLISIPSYVIVDRIDKRWQHGKIDLDIAAISVKVASAAPTFVDCRSKSDHLILQLYNCQLLGIIDSSPTRLSVLSDDHSFIWATDRFLNHIPHNYFLGLTICDIQIFCCC